MQSNDIINVLKNEDANSFITEHIGANLPTISLKYAGKTSFNFTVCLQLMAVYVKAQKKIPLFWEKRLALDQRSYEQCTSQAVAEYKSTLIKGGTLLDVTGGIGVDSIFLSPNFEKVTAVEQNFELHELAAYNVEKLGLHNVSRLFGDGSLCINQSYDWIYADPDRRPGAARVVALPLLEPNVLDLLPLMGQWAIWVYIKLSPLFDLAEIWRHFTNVHCIHIIAERGEIKEVGVILKMSQVANTKLVILKDVYSDFYAELNMDEQIEVNYSDTIAKRNLQVPIALVSKVQAFHFFLRGQTVAKHDSFDLYFSESEYIYGFRSFEIIAYKKLNVKELKTLCRDISGCQVNIVIKGMKDTPAEWHKKLGTKDGGAYFLFLLRGNKSEALITKAIF